MLFNDNQGFVILVSSLVIVEKFYNPDMAKFGIRYVALQGLTDQQMYLTEAIRDAVYDRCIQQWGQQQREGDEFQRFMQEHTVKGARLAEERAEKEEKGWE